MSNILDRIILSKRMDLEWAQRMVPESELERRIGQAPPPRDFRAALTKSNGIRVIAEIKRASPSGGLLREKGDAVAIARSYERYGAACISVLTDAPFFHGSLEDLTQVRRAVDIPVLRKDFLLERYQVLEARAAGADAVLLIAELLDDQQLKSLLEETHRLGMEALVEFHDPANLPRVLASGAGLIGINNRDLQNLETSLQHTLTLAPQVPRDRTLVSESGIGTRTDIKKLMKAGVHAVLVGETLMRARDPGAKLAQLLGRKAYHGKAK